MCRRSRQKVSSLGQQIVSGWHAIFNMWATSIVFMSELKTALWSTHTVHSRKSTCYIAHAACVWKDLMVLVLSNLIRICSFDLIIFLILKLSVFSDVAECNIHTSPSPGIQVRHVYTPSTTKHFSPIKQSTTLTNKHRGNEVSTTPLLVNCKYPSAF